MNAVEYSSGVRWAHVEVNLDVDDFELVICF